MAQRKLKMKKFVKTPSEDMQDDGFVEVVVGARRFPNFDSAVIRFEKMPVPQHWTWLDKSSSDYCYKAKLHCDIPLNTDIVVMVNECGDLIRWNSESFNVFKFLSDDDIEEFLS